jgi:hypothetical protein
MNGAMSVLGYHNLDAVRICNRLPCWFMLLSGRGFINTVFVQAKAIIEYSNVESLSQEH